MSSFPHYIYYLGRIYNSNLSRNLKVRIFKSTVETVFLYSCEVWTMDKALTKRIVEHYTHMLRMVLNVSWKQKLTNHQPYKQLPKLSETVRSRRLRLAGQFFQYLKRIAHHQIWWKLEKRTLKRGRRTINYIDNLREDTGLQDINEVKKLMEDRDV